MERSVTVATRLSPSTVNELDRLIEMGQFKNMSKAIEALTHLGLQVYQYQKMAKDPKKLDEFATKVKDMMESSKFEEVVNTMNPSELDGASMFIEIAKKRQYEQRGLV